MRIVRKGTKVYANTDITSRDLLPGVSFVFEINIPAGTKGKVTDPSWDEPLVDFGDEYGEWYVPKSLLTKRKP